MNPQQLFSKTIIDAIQKKPQTKAEAVALFKYILTSEIEPLIKTLITDLVATLPAPEQELAKTALFLVEEVAEEAKCRCW